MVAMACGVLVVTSSEINHPAKGPAPPGSILSRCSLVFMLLKKYIYIYLVYI